MNIQQLKQAVTLAYNSRQPLFIWGKPGIGKSQATAQVARELGIQMIDLRLTLLEPIDLRGLPTIKGGKTTWITPDFLPREGKGILFLDEFAQAVPSMQAAASPLILDRRLGDYELPEGWSVIAAGNRSGDRSATYSMPRMMSNRFVHVTAEESIAVWTEWAVQEDLDTRVIGFLNFRPELLCSFDPQSKEEAFATPRSWEFVNKLLSSGTNGAVLSEMIKGTVGQAAAAEFMGYLKVFRELPNLQDIFINPNGVAIPSGPSTLYAVTSALVSKANERNAGRAVAYFNRITKETARPEYAVLGGKLMSKRIPSVVNSPEYTDWIQLHNSVLV